MEWKKLGIIGGEHIAIDTSKLDSYDASVPKSRVIQDREHPDWGSKRDTHGNQVRWFGWKLHAAVDTKSELPVSVNVTPASVNDGIMAVPLVEDIQKRYSGIINPKYYIMDMGYDIEHIYRTIHDQYNASGHNPYEQHTHRRQVLTGTVHLYVLWDIGWPTGAMIMGILSFAVLIWRVKLTVQWALTGAHPAITALWLRKRYLIIQGILLTHAEDRPNGRNYTVNAPLLKEPFPG